MMNFAERNVPDKMTTKTAHSGEDMMKILADDVLRYELFTEQLTEQQESALIDGLRGDAVEFPVEVDKENQTC